MVTKSKCRQDTPGGTQKTCLHFNGHNPAAIGVFCPSGRTHGRIQKGHDQTPVGHIKPVEMARLKAQPQFTPVDARVHHLHTELGHKGRKAAGN